MEKVKGCEYFLKALYIFGVSYCFCADIIILVFTAIVWIFYQCGFIHLDIEFETIMLC